MTGSHASPGIFAVMAALGRDGDAGPSPSADWPGAERRSRGRRNDDGRTGSISRSQARTSGGRRRRATSSSATGVSSKRPRAARLRRRAPIDAGRPPLRGRLPGAPHPPRQGADQRRCQGRTASGTLDEAIEIIWARKRDYTVEEIAARAVRTIQLRRRRTGSRASAATSTWTASAASAPSKACSKRASAPATSPTCRSWPSRRRASSRTRAPTI